jgi:hypothetical protein
LSDIPVTGFPSEFLYRVRYYLEAEVSGRTLREAETRLRMRLDSLARAQLHREVGEPTVTSLYYLGGEPHLP